MEILNAHSTPLSEDDACRAAVFALHRGVIEKSDNVYDLLWKTLIAYQNYPFYTSKGLPFFYTVKHKKNGEYSGELEISRKEESKTLTRSSVFLAFQIILENMPVMADCENAGSHNTVFEPKEYKGPKAIGQIFGISYIYSMFWKFGLIKVPDKVAVKLNGQTQKVS